jgi:hypothetical protein
MTQHSLAQAVRASDENMSRLAWRTAVYQRMDHKKFPRTESAIFATAKPDRQSLQEQYRMARLITKVMQ